MPRALPPETALLLAELRAARPAALRRLRRALREHSGSVTAAAASLGLHASTVQRLRVVPEVRAVLEAEAMGRSGAARVARESREDSKG